MAMKAKQAEKLKEEANVHADELAALQEVRLHPMCVHFGLYISYAVCL